MLVYSQLVYIKQECDALIDLLHSQDKRLTKALFQNGLCPIYNSSGKTQTQPLYLPTFIWEIRPESAGICQQVSCKIWFINTDRCMKTPVTSLYSIPWHKEHRYVNMKWNPNSWLEIVKNRDSLKTINCFKLIAINHILIPWIFKLSGSFLWPSAAQI